ncbi:hypothetical protein [Streptomyces sp. enrichment culture]|uniref:hypothetical protein n=1 Tax=Streptomyces sp. enrichment culture TaxID=1795815 RepID=UPI003F57E608
MAAGHPPPSVTPTSSAGLISDLAYQAAWRNDHTLAQDLLGHALTRARHPAARSLLNLRLARSLAASPTPARTPALRALRSAERDLHRAGADRPAWCSWMSEADLAVDTGQTLLDLGDTSLARQLLTQGEHLLPATRDKTRGIFLAYQAANYLARHDIEPAATPGQTRSTSTSTPASHANSRTTRPPDPAFRPYAHHHAVERLLPGG